MLQMLQLSNEETQISAPFGDMLKSKASGTRQPWKFWTRSEPMLQEKRNATTVSDEEGELKIRPEKWRLGILNDRETDEVPGKTRQETGLLPRENPEVNGNIKIRKLIRIQPSRINSINVKCHPE